MLHEGGRVERVSHLDTAHKAFHRHVGGEVEGLRTTEAHNHVNVRARLPASVEAGRRTWTSSSVAP